MKKPNYDLEQVCLIEDFGSRLETLTESEKATFKRNLLQLTKRERFRLAKLECENESTTTT